MIAALYSLFGLDADMTAQGAMMEVIDDLITKKGKGRIAKAR